MLFLLSLLPLLATSAVPVVQGAFAPELTPATFASTTSKGLWLVEHFSPYCTHCRKFKPTWEQLVQDSEKEIPDVRLATVNCVQHGDLCDANGVKGYPSIIMFSNGEKQTEFNKARDITLLKEYMKGFVPEKTTNQQPVPAPHIHDEDDEDPVVPPPPVPAAVPKVEDHHEAEAPAVIPPPPAPAAPPKRASQDTNTNAHPELNPNGAVLSLSTSSFALTLSKGPAFVKFYAPWCGHCKKLAPTWKKLAEKMKGKVTVAEVNCDDEGALCKGQGIQGYPTLVWFGAGEGEKNEYQGSRKLDVMEEFIVKASNSGIHPLENDAELATFTSTHDVVYLLLHQPFESGIISRIRDASRPLLGSPPVLSSSSPTLLSEFGVGAGTPWALVALKEQHGSTDYSLPSSTYTATRSQSATASGAGYDAAKDEDVKAWLMEHRLPTSLELSQGTFQMVMNAPQKPLVVIAAVDLSSDAASEAHAKVTEHLKDIATKWRRRTGGTGLASGREVIFTAMDSGKWATWLKSMYGIKGGDEPTRVKDVLEGIQVVVADHGQLVYYNTDAAGQAISFTSISKLFTAVEDAAAGKSPYKNSENFAERLARRLNHHLQSLESYVTQHPFKSILFGLGLVVAFIWGLSRLLSLSGTGSGVDDWREMKGKNGRLD